MGGGGLGSAGRSAEGARGTELGGTAASLCSDMKVRSDEGPSMSRARYREGRFCALRWREGYSCPRPAAGFHIFIEGRASVSVLAEGVDMTFWWLVRQCFTLIRDEIVDIIRLFI
jgi:hypothetical protein